MEFIPIKKFADKKKKYRKIDESIDESEPPRKQFKKEKHAKPSSNKVKPKPQGKKVKNKYKERLEEKQKEKSKKKKLKQGKVEVEDKNEDDEEEEEHEILNETTNEDDDDQDSDENVVNSEEDETEEVEEEEEENEEEEEDEEEKLKKEMLKRRKELDEKIKNRLFIKLKSKILSEAQIKALHENIRGVVFPRKKNSCWCWAIFASEERANEALKKLKKNKDIIATKPLPREQVEMKLKEKKSDNLRKKKARKKLESMWL